MIDNRDIKPNDDDESTMSKKHPTQEHQADNSGPGYTFDLGTSRMTVADHVDDQGVKHSWRDSDVVIVYRGAVGTAEATHRAPIGGLPKGGDIDGIMIEPGASFVQAGLLRDHLEHPHNVLRSYIDRGELEIYATPEDAIARLSVKRCEDVIELTRSAAMLRAWLAVEQTRQVKRPSLVKLLERKIRAWGDHSTPVISLDTIREALQPREPARSRVAG